MGKRWGKHCACFPSARRRWRSEEVSDMMAIMAPETENLVLEHLRHMRAAMDVMRDDIREIKTRLGIIEQQYASLSNRIDRIEGRLDRIEKRLELADA
jgi:predicted nuclease with TOPRIM domain